MGVFDAFVDFQGNEMTLDELSQRVKGDEKLLSRCPTHYLVGRVMPCQMSNYREERVMRFLCAHQLFTQPARESYKPLSLALAFANGSGPADMIKHCHNNMQVTAKLFSYLSSNGYKNPEDASNAPFQLAYNTQSHYFDWLRQNPDAQGAFNSVMTQTQQYRGADWFDIYPVEERLRISPDRVLLVDIGGGVGHDILAFRRRFPKLSGKLVLQDLPQVIDSLDHYYGDRNPFEVSGAAAEAGGITPIAHNMFEPQPITGARVYYMRTVLHDFPDKQALLALARVREAMANTPDSVLFVHEHIMADGLDVPPLAAILDIHMMEIFSSLERTEREWVDLLERAGFRVARVWNEESVGQSTALFEAVVV
ncbi:S-adenosyl-L-methionine-dependent methyltransferase [Aspergillus venezuelensis]